MPRSRSTGPADRPRGLVSIVLFAALGLAGAFLVSAVAGLWDDEPAETGLRALARGLDDRGAIRVEVLNGAGTPGLARDGTRHLRAAGFDVVFFGNAARFDHARSFVLDRRGDTARARVVAASLGIDSVATAIDSSLMLEVTVLLGDDWPPEAEVRRGWRDRLRGLVGRDTAPAGADSGDADPDGGG